MDSVKRNLQTHIEKMCLEYGSRHCGSSGERLTAEYIEQYFTGLGLEVVSEEYPVRGWNFESFALYNVTKNRPVSGGTTACFFSAAVDLEGPLLFLTNEDLHNIENVPIQGRMCFVTNSTGFDRNNLAERLEALGAAAAIFSCKHAGAGADTKVTRSPHIQKIGTACVNLTGAYDIAKNASDTYRLRIQANSFDTTSRNIIARAGKGLKKCVIGGHYDTAPLIQGANDNASGTAMVMELARLMTDADLPFVLEFVAFSGEEYCEDKGPIGSADYVARHKDEEILWFLNCDSCGDAFTTPNLLLGVKEKLPALSCKHEAIDREVGGDNGPFCAAKIPVAWLAYATGFPMLHTLEDSADKLDYNIVAENFADIYDLLQQLIRGTKI